MNLFSRYSGNFLQAVKHWFLFVILFFSVISGGCREEIILESSQSCNGSPDFCNHIYTQHTYAGTHNSFAYEPEFHNLVANQKRNISQQLQDGIRCLNLDVWWLTGDAYCVDSAIYVYHNFPGFGCLFFTDILLEVKQFMDNQPNEVITITIEDTNTNINQLLDAFSFTQLSDYLFIKQSNQSWPTLKEMIDSKRRLVVFANVSNPNNLPGILSNWNHMFDNPYSAQSRYDFSCSVNRGNIDHDLYLLNHFITVINPRYDSAVIVNSKASLLQHIDDCKMSTGRYPNFIYNDFYETGDMISIADSLNRNVWQ
ncbi:MAG: phosphatidylinositol-specific phospholipase C domain-containing protein [Sphingobacteriales bacterium]|nr:MAG: phosphatidylinositol-specific phospholipase C domain-containing protein [Sphingobacteriales bacterium]